MKNTPPSFRSTSLPQVSILIAASLSFSPVLSGQIFQEDFTGEDSGGAIGEETRTLSSNVQGGVGDIEFTATEGVFGNAGIEDTSQASSDEALFIQTRETTTTTTFSFENLNLDAGDYLVVFDQVGRIDGQNFEGTMEVFLNGQSAGVSTNPGSGQTVRNSLSVTVSAGGSFVLEFVAANATGSFQQVIVDNVSVFESSSADTDADGLLDSWEEEFFPGDLTRLTGLATGPGPGANSGDFDDDDLTDLNEFRYFGNPDKKDSDDDDLDDGEEVEEGTDLNNQDTDGDDINDGTEVMVTETSPIEADSDFDGLTDLEEDLNADGILDNGETDPNSQDTDSDMLLDAFEVSNNLDPQDATGENGGEGNPDGDAYSNLEEQALGFDPKSFDQQFLYSENFDDEEANGTIGSETVDLSSDSPGEDAADTSLSFTESIFDNGGIESGASGSPALFIQTEGTTSSATLSVESLNMAAGSYTVNFDTYGRNDGASFTGTLEVKLNGVSAGMATFAGQDSVTLNSLEVTLPVSGVFLLEFEAINDSGVFEQPIIDNITVSAGAGGNALEIDSFESDGTSAQLSFTGLPNSDYVIESSEALVAFDETVSRNLNALVATTGRVSGNVVTTDSNGEAEVNGCANFFL